MEYDVIVIGGGAAGMMAAGQAARRGKKVLLLERNRRLGEKLRITGGTRCNITNAEKDVRVLLSKYGEAEQALYSSFAEFGVKETFEFFESRGLPLKVEANNRAFPVTEKAPDVVKVLEEDMKKVGVRTVLGAGVTRIDTNSGRITGVAVKDKMYTARNYILATGGMSHPETGSTGDGFGWLRGFGHTVEAPTPTIVPLKVREGWVKKLSGAKAEGAKITFSLPSGKKISRSGSILFTHFGISGPTVLNAAGQVADMLQESVVTARIDLYPGMDLGILDKHIAKVFDAHKNKNLKNVFRELVPPGTSEILLEQIPLIDKETKVHSVRKEDRRVIAELLKGLTFTVTGLMGFERAVVADGGLILREVDMRTMRSKKFENLYVTGDLLHITRPSGGYSLQLCWTTGYVAGNSVA